jgi:hypothetical protein
VSETSAGAIVPPWPNGSQKAFEILRKAMSGSLGGSWETCGAHLRAPGERQEAEPSFATTQGCFVPFVRERVDIVSDPSRAAKLVQTCPELRLKATDAFCVAHNRHTRFVCTSDTDEVAALANRIRCRADSRGKSV